MTKQPSNFIKIGDPRFIQDWQFEKSQDAQIVLRRMLDASVFQRGSDIRQISLEALFNGQLSPADPFWQQLAHLVQQAFPLGLFDQQLSSAEKVLAQRVHQFRYLIDSWLVSYVRSLSGQASDRQKLIDYLKTFPAAKERWSIGSPRLHEKELRPDLAGHTRFYLKKVNYKILINFHVEFILTEEGRFLTILSPEPGAVINGASFNFADGNDYHANQTTAWNHHHSRHFNLDIEPVSHYDPEFRLVLLKTYRAPNLKEFSRGCLLRPAIKTRSARLAKKFTRSVHEN
ncbi:DUF3114 domain-containing protein [Oenococcus sp.]|uniref:DUF3114 domain-containing protein n=1 Tax=Oenococcus sp. TaxID=1979414 RepID=UPI0039EC6AAA